MCLPVHITQTSSTDSGIWYLKGAKGSGGQTSLQQRRCSEKEMPIPKHLVKMLSQKSLLKPFISSWEPVHICKSFQLVQCSDLEYQLVKA